MAQVKCQNCGEALSQGATICPGCGAAIGAKSRWFSVVIFLIAAAGLFAYYELAKLNEARDLAACESIKTELASLAAAQEEYRKAKWRYAADIDSIKTFKYTGAKVRLRITRAGVESFAATGSHIDCSESVNWDSSRGGLLP